MSDTITVRVLSDLDFDNLGYEDTRGANVSASLGFADVKRRRVYVRDTGVHDLNKYLLNHELEHLFEEKGTDEDPNVEGIRHKFWIPLLLTALGAGAATASAASGAKNAGKAQGEMEQQTRLANQAANQQPSSPFISQENQNAQSGLAGLNTPKDPSIPGSATSPLNLFGTGQSAASPTAPGGTSGLTSGLDSGLDKDLQEKLKGQYAGRLVF